MPKRCSRNEGYDIQSKARALRETRQNRKQENTFNSEDTNQEGEPSRTSLSLAAKSGVIASLLGMSDGCLGLFQPKFQHPPGQATFEFCRLTL